jgi:hypothetical protein
MIWGAHARLPRPLPHQIPALLLHLRREALAQLGRETEDPSDTPIDLDTVTVVNDWALVHIGHRNHAERELAVAIAERNRQQRQSTTRQRSAA